VMSYQQTSAAPRMGHGHRNLPRLLYPQHRARFQELRLLLRKDARPGAEIRLRLNATHMPELEEVLMVADLLVGRFPRDTIRIMKH
jgi:hypothetical protein